jgi:hypothetical protein
MQTGVLLNAFTCLLISIAAVSTAVRIFRHPENDFSDLAYAGFWFLTALSWLFVGTSMVFAKYNLLNSGITIDQYFTQTTAFVQMAIGSIFASYRVFKKRQISTIFFLVFLIMGCVSLFYVYQNGGVVITKESYFSVEYRTNQTSWLLFQIMFAVLLVGIIVDVLRNLYFRLKKNPLYQQKYLLAGLAVCAYGAVCYFEEQGYYGSLSDLATWIRLGLRMMLIACVMVAFLAYSEKDN